MELRVYVVKWPRMPVMDTTVAPRSHPGSHCGPSADSDDLLLAAVPGPAPRCSQPVRDRSQKKGGYNTMHAVCPLEEESSTKGAEEEETGYWGEMGWRGRGRW